MNLLVVGLVVANDCGRQQQIAPGEFVTVIDDLLGDDAREFAARAKTAIFKPFVKEHQDEFHGQRIFRPRRPATVFPGVAASLDDDYVEAVRAKVAVSKNGSFYGLVCFDVGGLAREQRAPHVDRGMPDPSMALVHYLAEDWHGGGTAFYKERSTQRSLFNAPVDSYFFANSRAYNCSVSRKRQFKPECRDLRTSVDRDDRPFYQAGSDDDFELLHVVPYKFDRAVLYDAKQLHSAYLDADTVTRLSCDPTQGRLVASFFLF